MKLELKEGDKILITQVRGSGRRTKPVLATLNALGLGRTGRKKEHTFNKCIYGMINRVEHLVSIEKL
ncbi:MAG: 50S ribosomal protein L30 [Bdellovibrionota bacterium]